MSDQVWLAIIAASAPITTIVTTFILSLKTDATKKAVETTKAAVETVAVKADIARDNLAKKVDDAAAKAAEVKDQLVITTVSADKKLDDLTVVAQTTHSLVNSSKGASLELSKDLARRLASITKDPEDIKIANIANQLYLEHVSHQISPAPIPKST